MTSIHDPREHTVCGHFADRWLSTGPDGALRVDFEALDELMEEFLDRYRAADARGIACDHREHVDEQGHVMSWHERELHLRFAHAQDVAAARFEDSANRAAVRAKARGEQPLIDPTSAREV